MINLDLSKIIKEVSEEDFQAEYQPVLDISDVPVPRPSSCIIPPGDPRDLTLDELIVPEIEKGCLTNYTPIVPIALPYVSLDVIVPCPDGITFEPLLVSVDNSVNNGGDVVTTPYEITNEGCVYTIPEIQVIVPTIPCPEGISFSTDGFYIIVDDPNGCSVRHDIAVTTETRPKAVMLRLSASSGLQWSDDTYRTATDPEEVKTVTWTAATGLSGVTLRSLAYNNDPNDPVHVAGGDTGKLAYSTDGKAWAYSTTGSINFAQVAYGCSEFVAIGNSGGNAFIYDTIDGSSWSAVSVTGSLTGATLNALAYGNSQFLAVGNSGKLVRSNSDGTWTVLTAVAATNLTSIAYGMGKHVAGGANGYIYYSSDAGDTWTPALVNASYAIRQIIFVDRDFIVVNTNGDSYRASPSNLASISASGLPPLGGSNILYDKSGRIIVLGDNAGVYTASNTQPVYGFVSDGAPAWLTGSYIAGESNDTNCSIKFDAPITIRLPKIPVFPTILCGSGTAMSVGDIEVVAGDEGLAELVFTSAGPCGYTLGGTITVPSGGFSFKGEWDVAYTATHGQYHAGDIVIRSSFANLVNGCQAGTYRAKINHDSDTVGAEPLEPADGVYWERIARGAWPVMTIQEGCTSEGDKPFIISDARTTASANPTECSTHWVSSAELGVQIEIDTNDIGDEYRTESSQVKFREITVCSGGNKYKMMVLGSVAIPY